MRFAPRDPAFIADPYPVYRELRDRRFGRTYLHATTHAEIGNPRIPRGTNRSGT
jgi:hypothetical protein